MIADIDHPHFPSQLRHVIETSLGVALRGVAQGVFKVALGVLVWGNSAPAGSVLWDASRLFPILTTLVLEGLPHGVTFKQHFNMIYGFEIGICQRLLLTAVYAVGFLLTTIVLAGRDEFFLWPLHLAVPQPPKLIYAAYAAFVLWQLTKLTPSIRVVPAQGTLFIRPFGRWTSSWASSWISKRRAAIWSLVVRNDREGAVNVSPPYKYDAIHDSTRIRLLKVSTTTEGTSCTLETFKIEEAPAYWAVSYVWGVPSTTTFHLRIGGPKGKGSYLPIGQNCSRALLQLLPLRTKYLWIDAICINQEDDREKEFQVPLMDKIYSAASYVMGHLPDDEAYGIEEFVEDMALGCVPMPSSLREIDFTSEAARANLNTLASVLSSDYWNRAWIFQEIVLAKNHIIVRSRECLRFSHLALISQQAWFIMPKERVDPLAPISSWDPSRFHEHSSSFLERVNLIDTMRRSTTAAPDSSSRRLKTIEVVNLASIPLRATVARDQFYAMLSLGSDSGAEALRPNYDRTVTDATIFTRIALHYLCSKDGSSLSNFLRAGMAYRDQTPNPTPDLPSWVQDFACMGEYAVRHGNWLVAMERERQCRLETRISNGDKVLSVQGVEIDRVCKVLSSHVREFDRLLPDVTPVEINRIIAGLLASAQRLVETKVPDTYSPGGQSRAEVYWRTMIMDRFGNETPAPFEAKQLFTRTVRELECRTTNAPSPYSGRGMDMSAARDGLQWRAWMIVWLYYAFAVTEKGYVGWVPDGTQEGDVMVLFDNCEVPFVLRPDNGDGYFLYGDGYLQGFVHSKRSDLPQATSGWFKLV